MPLIIDGYNLLHVTGIFGKGRGPGGLHRSRRALLRFLAATIDPGERPRTAIVFDASDAPPGLPRSEIVADMSVLYAANYADADAMIEELIAQHDAPRSLLVVSSDHRIQRAARRRRAQYVDSDVWYADMVRKRDAARRGRAPPAKPAGPLSEAEIEYWLQEFDVETDDPTDAADARGKLTPRRPASGGAADDQRSRPRTEQTPPESTEPWDPFPPGYGEDLSENDLD